VWPGGIALAHLKINRDDTNNNTDEDKFLSNAESVVFGWATNWSSDMFLLLNWSSDMFLFLAL
jgi:hypothetical protein